jgi:hypothetical protein
MIITFLLILLASFFLTIRSMSDFQTPRELRNLFSNKKWLGTIIFFGKEIKHYSSSSISVSSDKLKSEN